MPSLIPRWKKKKPSTFKDLSPSDRDYLVDMLQATPPNQSVEESNSILQRNDEPDLQIYNDPAPVQSPPTSDPNEPAIPKPTFESFLRMANETVKCWERRETRIANSIKARLASNFSLEINSYMKEYAARTRMVSSRKHIHRIVEQCVLTRRNLREIRDVLQDLQDHDPIDDKTRQLMEETWRVMVSLEHDNWIEVEYALENQ
ncbi:hypothetical protein PMG11_09263 [Penicillium brasilianum]|uniref:Uncharacterized protein n=1 Tax=Penicillium brasilianum TaxID=104259 RepID=A0A0F7TZ36_PENBI|nr:hypothetical protein PMG11_09263 [Penicillium brasilianum]